MPTPCYLSVFGKNQGLITKGASGVDSIGDRYVEGHEDQLIIQSVGHTSLIPCDRQSGQPTGQRIHGPFKVVCEITKALPLFYNALCTGELLENVTLDWYRISVEGKTERFFQTTLINAQVTNIELLMPDSRYLESKPFTQFVNLSFSFRCIEWNHMMSNTLGIDNWRKPVEA